MGCRGNVGFEGGFLCLRYCVCLTRHRFVVRFRDLCVYEPVCLRVVRMMF